MAKFDLKKAILENKATFHSSLTEGQFSWFTQDTDQQIGSEPENTITVFMHDDKGNVWAEKNYEGYGEFGGMDYYELLDKMNGGRGDRGRGIDLAFGSEKVASKVLFPALTTSPKWPSSHDFTQEAEHDPNQSWYAGEDDDDDYITGDRDDEYLQEAELPALELDQVQNIAQQVADEFTKYENELDLKFSITPDSVEASPKGAGFDLDIAAGPNTPGDDWKDEKGFGIENYLGKFAGGSYIIKSEGDKHKIYNAATGNSYIGYVTPQGEVVFEYEKSMNEAEEAPKSNKMKKSELKELIKSSIMEYERDVDYTDETSGYDFLAEIDAILAEAEGDEEVAVDDTEVTVDGEENIDVDTTTEVDPNVKAVQDALTQAQAAAQKLGDKKLTDQIGNTITFFTRAHVVDKGAIAEGEEDVTSIGKKVETAVEDKLEATVSKLSDEQKDQLKAELAKLGVTATSNVKDVAAKLNESLYEAEGDTKAKVASALQDIGGGLMKSLLVPIIPVAIGSLGPGVAAGFAITAGVAGGLIALAKLLGAEKSMEEGKKEYYKDAEADDAEHIKALEKDIKADKKELEEGVWSFLPDRVPEFVKAVEELKDEYHGVVGDDDIFDHLDGAIRRAEELRTIYDSKPERTKFTIPANENEMEEEKESSMKIKEVVFPMWQRINK